MLITKYLIVEDRGFRNLMSTVESKCKLPTRLSLSFSLISQLYSKQLSQLKEDINTDLINTYAIQKIIDI